MIENFAAQLRLLAPTAHDPVRARIFSLRHAFVRQVGDLEQQTPFSLFEHVRARRKIDNLFADFAHSSFQFGGRLSLGTFRADLFA